MINRSRLWIGSGIAGVAAVACYILATAVVSWPDTQLGVSSALLVVSAWPILSIIYAYGLYGFVAAERDSPANALAMIFAVAAFSMVLAMIVVQLAVDAGMTEIAKASDPAAMTSLKRGLRLIDMGLDVAWDMLIGMALICSGIALRRRSGFGPWWAFPPIGLLVMALAARLALLGHRAAHA